MDIIFSLLFLVFGAIVGSFLNVVILRLNTGRGIGGRSGCMSCGKVLGAFELVPVASFLLQGGKCTKCKSKLSWQYPIVEALSAIVFFLLGHMFFPSVLDVHASAVVIFALYAIIFSLLIVIAAYDFRHTVIPDRLVFAFIILSFLTTSIAYGPAFSYMYIFYAVLLAVPFALLWYVSKGKWMGLGDAKLALGIGFLLGGSAGLLALMFGFWAGAIVAVMLMLFKKKGVSMKTEIPFAPFLILGTLLVFFLKLDIASFMMLFIG